MLLDPVLTALAFKLKLPPEERPLRSAMFLPIVQFLRFVKGVYRTCSCARAVKTTESAETEAQYAITVTIQTGPQLILQTSIIFLATFLSNVPSNFEVDSDSWKPPAALVLSIICSFLSACYNSGRACMYQISNKWSIMPNMAGIVGVLVLQAERNIDVSSNRGSTLLKSTGALTLRHCEELLKVVALCAGVYTVGVVLLRCTIVYSLFFQANFLQYLFSYLVLGIGMCSYVNALLVAFSKRRTMCSWATQAEILLNTYNSACIGPLYPIVENDNRSSYNDRRWSLRVGIALGVAINMLPDMVSLLVVVIQKRTSCNNKLVSEKVVKFIFSWGLFKSYAATGILLSILSSVALYFIAKHTSPHTAVLDT